MRVVATALFLLWVGCVLAWATYRIARIRGPYSSPLDVQFWCTWIAGAFLLLCTVFVRVAHYPHWIGTLLWGVSTCFLLNSLGCVARIRNDRRKAERAAT